MVFSSLLVDICHDLRQLEVCLNMHLAFLMIETYSLYNIVIRVL